MNLGNLTDEELRTFLEGQPIDELRSVFINVDSVRKNLKGFRPNTAPSQVLINTSFNIVRKEKNGTLATILFKKYKDYVSDIYDGAKTLEEDGYPHYGALAVIIGNGFNSQFRKIFYKLEEYSDDQIQKIDESISLLSLIDAESKRIVSKETQKVDFSKKIEKISTDVKKISDGIDDAIESIDDHEKELKSLGLKIDALKKELTSISSKKTDNQEIENKINEEMSKIKKELKTLANNETIALLKKEIDELKKAIKNIPQIKKNDFYECEIVKATDFSEMEDCEYLGDDIVDVIEKVVDDKKYDTFKEFLIETIYGNKPIITANKNVNLVAEIYASIMAGGEYYSVDVNENYSFSKLTATIENVSTEKENLVFVVKGLINSYDHRSIVAYLTKQPFTHKFIFDIQYEAEARFMPPEILNAFYCLFGDFKDAPIEYRYIHKFEERMPLTNNVFDKTLSQLDVSMDDKKLFNVKHYGLLAYSIIPFTALNRGLDKNELISLILDADTRKRCEAILDD